jgi:hypothetical protein
MAPIVGVIGDEGTDDAKLIAGYFISDKPVKIIGGKMRIYISEKNPYIVFGVKYGTVDTHGQLSWSRGCVEFNIEKEPQYYYPTFAEPLDKKDPENTFKKRCTIEILKRAQKIHDEGSAELLKRYSQSVKKFMRKAEDLFELNGIP